MLDVAGSREITVESREFRFSLCAAACCPVHRATRAAAIGSGKDRALAGPPSHRLRGSLLAMQIARSTTLLVGAGLLTRAISHAMSLDPGFAIAGIQEVSLELPHSASLDDLSTIREALATSGLPPMANDDPIGKRLVTGASDAPPESHEIVGVVADVPTTTLTEVEPVIYQPVRAARFVLLRDPSPAVSARIRELVQSSSSGSVVSQSSPGR